MSILAVLLGDRGPPAQRLYAARDLLRGMLDAGDVVTCTDDAMLNVHGLIIYLHAEAERAQAAEPVKTRRPRWLQFAGGRV